MENSESSVKYEIDTEFGDFILSESPNRSLILRKISWNDKPPRLDIRNYFYKDEQEFMARGITMSDFAANKLTEILVDKGYGDSNKLMLSLVRRKDLKMRIPENDNNTDFHDANELLS